MEKKFFLFLCSIILVETLWAQNPEDATEYSFIFFNPLAKSDAMRRNNENLLSIYRFAVREIDKNIFPSDKKSSMILGMEFLILFPFTQNAAQQSILYNEGISSSSVPHFFNSKFSPYVHGVRDADLQHLRDTQLPTYIRLHISPYESDYALAIRSNSLLSWDKETPEVLKLGYIVFKYRPFAYYFWSMLDRRITKSDSNELDRDITGNKIYGAIRHLHRPDMEFQRYTNYTDLTETERQFVKRVGWRSFLNLLDPTMFFWNGFRLRNGDKFNFMLGYNMSPFGDYIDQHFWLMSRNFNTHFYFREHENRNTWFPEAGIEFAYIQPFSWLIFNVGVQGWSQPQNLDFNTNRGRLGGAIDATFKFMDYQTVARRNTYLSFNVSITAKTQGYLLETTSLGNNIDMRIGASIWFE